MTLTGTFAQATAELDLEVLIADGGSSDGTAERIRAWQAKVPVRFIEGGGGRGLAGDVLIAAEQASSPIIVVMDADLSHPPTAILSSWRRSSPAPATWSLAAVTRLAG